MRDILLKHTLSFHKKKAYMVPLKWKTWISELLLLYNCPSNTYITLKNALFWSDIWILSFAIKCYVYTSLNSEFFQNYCISRILICKKLIYMLFSCPKKEILGYIMWYSFFNHWRYSNHRIINFQCKIKLKQIKFVSFCCSVFAQIYNILGSKFQIKKNIYP